MSTGYLHIHEPVIPWSFGEQGDERFSKILKRVLFFFLLLSVVIPYLPLPEKKKDEIRPIPPQLARLIMERQKTPPPKPVSRKREAVKKKQQVRKRQQLRQKKVARARARASRSGLLALSGELASLRDNSSVTRSLSKDLSTSSSTGSSKPSASARRVEKSSGGISTARLSRDTGGTGLGVKSAARVKSATLDGSRAAAHASESRGSRKAESLRLVFDRYKSAIYRIYSRELRKDPGLQGKVVLEITISASGQVLACRVLSSDLDSKTFLAKLVARVKLFDFGPRPGGTAKVRYPIEFFPS